MDSQRREGMLKFQRNTVLDQLADAEGFIGYLEAGLSAYQARVTELQQQIEAARQEGYDRGFIAGKAAP